MTELFYDLETYSEADLKKVGGYVYAEHPSTEIMLFAWAIDDEPVAVWDLTTNEPMPDRLYAALTDSEVRKVAHNSMFDRTVLRGVLWIDVPADQHDDLMILANCLALPAGLADLGQAVGLGEDQAKLRDGQRLIQRFCSPAPSNHRTRRYTRENRPEDWERFIEYARRDVETMRLLWRKLPKYNYQRERPLWVLDQRINDRGIRVDSSLIETAQHTVREIRRGLTKHVREVTDGAITSLNQRDRILSWVRAYAPEIELPDCKAKTIEAALDQDLPPPVRQVLLARQTLGKASTAKLDAMARSAGRDERVRGALQFGGANRTLRWSGRLIQPQNYPRGFEEVHDHVEDLASGSLDLFYTDAMERISKLLRSMLVASPGYTLKVADLSQIEARVLPWLAEDEDTLDIFRAKRDLYVETAARIFRVPYDKVDKAQRFAGKVASLALGYGGGVGALQKMAAGYGQPLDDAFAQEIVDKWREANGTIKSWWYEMGKAAFAALRNPGVPYKARRVSWLYRKPFLLMKLPSGHYIPYFRPKVEIAEKSWGEIEQITYFGTNQKTKKWERLALWHGLACENGTQALARDVMTHNMPAVEAAGYNILLTVHDEIVTESPIGHGSVDELCSLLATNPPWAPGLPLAAEGFEDTRYHK